MSKEIKNEEEIKNENNVHNPECANDSHECCCNKGSNCNCQEDELKKLKDTIIEMEGKIKYHQAELIINFINGSQLLHGVFDVIYNQWTVVHSLPNTTYNNKIINIRPIHPQDLIITFRILSFFLT